MPTKVAALLSSQMNNATYLALIIAFQDLTTGYVDVQATDQSDCDVARTGIASVCGSAGGLDREIVNL